MKEETAAGVNLMLVIAVMAVICGANGWAEVELFGQTKQQWLATFLELPHGTPAHDTFGRVFALLDPDAFERCFLAWMAALVELSGGRLVAIDGKSIRRSFQRGWDKSGMAHLVSAFVCQGENKLVFAQLAVDGKSNEITVIPKLLELMDLRGRRRRTGWGRSCWRRGGALPPPDFSCLPGRGANDGPS